MASVRCMPWIHCKSAASLRRQNGIIQNCEHFAPPGCRASPCHLVIAKEHAMPAQPTAPADDQTWVTILDEATDYAFGNIFRIKRAKLQYRRFDGQMSAPIT